MDIPASGIYAIRNLVNGNLYVGSSAYLADRLNEHRCDLRKQCHPNKHLQRAWDKYGESAFEFTVIESVTDLAQLLEREQYWLDTLQPAYNILRKAGSALGFRHSSESIERMQLVQKGRPRTAEHRAKISATLKGRPLSPETIAKMSAARKGWRHSPESRAKIAATLMGHAITDEARERMGLANRGRKQPREVVEKRMASIRALGPRKPLVLTDAERQRRADAQRGKRHTPEASAKISAAVKARMADPEQRAHAVNALFGRPVTAETRAKISAANKGRSRTAEARAKMSESQRRRHERQRSGE